MSVSEEVRAAADLAALLPIDHPLARLGRLRLDAAVRRQNQEDTMTVELTPRDHNTDMAGAYIYRGALQDALELPCEHCGKRTNGQAYSHDLECPNYRPHPSSVAAHKIKEAEWERARAAGEVAAR
ncbi:hypothetical protein [Georgenia sp. AZ-5]|uniref:hypothetical protein n=1 Tax=Georgenia sp. AZ-5 TaxID=3367526 RepID=UPI0037542178